MRARRRRMVVAAMAAVTVLLFGLAACGNDDDGAGAPPPPKTERDAYTKWYVQQAVNRYEETGRQATLDYYNNEAGSDDQWYIFISDTETGTIAAHAAIPSRVGTYSADNVDITGHAYGELLMASPESGHWVDYVFYNPQTGTGATKHSWAVSRDNLVFGSGWYEDSYPVPRPTKSEPGSYTRAFVEDTVWFYESNGRDALIDHFNSPDSTDPASVDGQWYGFVADLNGVVLAHPTVPEYVGMTLHEILGATSEGRKAADEMATTTETGKWVQYTSTNPLTGSPAPKHSWVVKRDDILIGSGWYESG